MEKVSISRTRLPSTRARVSERCLYKKNWTISSAEANEEAEKKKTQNFRCKYIKLLHLHSKIRFVEDDDGGNICIHRK